MVAGKGLSFQHNRDNKTHGRRSKNMEKRHSYEPLTGEEMLKCVT